MEAALRTAVELVTGETLEKVEFTTCAAPTASRRPATMWAPAPERVRGQRPHQLRRSAEGCAERREALRLHRIHGMPGRLCRRRRTAIHDGEELAFARGKKLYELDAESELRYSHENPDIKEIYSDFFGKPMSHKAHMLLHTEHWKNK